MFAKRVRDSAIIILLALALSAVVLLADAVAAQSDEYVMMTRADFDKLVRMLLACKGERI